MKKTGIFIQSILIFALILIFLRFMFPTLAGWIAGTQVTLPIPGTLFLWYVILIFIGFFLHVTSNEKTFDEFKKPVIMAIKGDRYKVMFKTIFILLPLIIGYYVYDFFVPKVVVPSSVRQQHPGMTGVNAQPYAGKKNPFRGLPEDEFDKVVVDGRNLYQKNCRPCHGTGHDGTGPMAKTFKLKPVAFTDPGTIATLVENAVFWRVSEGGIGLPDSATPWDSPMPKWKDELTEEERWKIITAIYEDVGMEPRKLLDME